MFIVMWAVMDTLATVIDADGHQTGHPLAAIYRSVLQ